MCNLKGIGKEVNKALFQRAVLVIFLLQCHNLMLSPLKLLGVSWAENESRSVQGISRQAHMHI